MISEALEARGVALGMDAGAGSEGLDLSRKRIGDAGAAVLGAALQAMPRIRFTDLRLNHNDLTAVGVASLTTALRRPWGTTGLRRVWVDTNPLGDAGVAALAKALPPTLEMLIIFETGCGDGGLVALAAKLSTLSTLSILSCGNLLATSARGWVALGEHGSLRVFYR